MAIVCGCSDTSETELTVYLLEEKIPDIKEHKKEIISALNPRKFKIWKNAKVVYQELFLDSYLTTIGTLNKDCIIEDKNNWCCYGSKKDFLNLYEYHLRTIRFIVENDWDVRDENVEQLVCYIGVINGKWILEEKYHEKNSTDTSRSIIYSVPYWKWLLYPKKGTL